VDAGGEAGRDVVTRYWVRVGDEEIEVGVDRAGGVLVVTVGGAARRVELTELVPSSYTLVVDGTCHDVMVQDRSGPWTLILDGTHYRAEIARTPRVGRSAGRETAPKTEAVRSPMPGVVVAVPVGEGERVEMGQAIAIMEAMKMQMEIRAPHAGTIKRIHVGPGQELAAGQLLVTLG
jgi:acetyl-CoA/propionyl-CoA carboxylase, biotin carboxylase, biotin carboxyl carrier protein